MTNKLEIGRELAELTIAALQEEGRWDVADRIEASLCAPVVERQEPVTWSYCPECGCEELHHEQDEHKQCANCHQEWFSDIDYSEVVRGNLAKLKAEQPAPAAVVLPMPCDKYDGIYVSCEDGPVFHKHDVIEAIQAAGLICIDKVKELSQ